MTSWSTGCHQPILTLPSQTLKRLLQFLKKDIAAKNGSDFLAVSVWVTGLSSGCRAILTWLANSLPCELSHTTLVTSQDHRHCSDDNMNVTDEVDRCIRSSSIFYLVLSESKKIRHRIHWVLTVDNLTSTKLKEILGAIYSILIPMIRDKTVCSNCSIYWEQPMLISILRWRALVLHALCDSR